MARHYSTKSFFRKIPNALLKRYFASQGLLEDFDVIKETKIDELFDAWLDLPDDKQKSIDAVFQDIFDMSCEKGFLALIDELDYQVPDDLEQNNIIEQLSKLSNHYHRAMVAYLDYRDCWNGAVRFCHADSLSYWRKRMGMGNAPAMTGAQDLDALAAKIKNTFT